LGAAARVDLTLEDWDGAAKAAADMMKADPRQQHPEAYLDQAVARFHLRDMDGAEASVTAAIRLDTVRRFPRSELILGSILAAKRDYISAGEHMSRYLELDPKALDAEQVREQIAELGKPEASEARVGIPNVEAASGEAGPIGIGEAWVPGGMKAL